ncbi:unnamed protein product [Adineta ricciae]|uniref:Uncharacterized protein n=1 Tax=Adineta ricciae TaxID=249248 RepID=A0A814F239_ADIRI|nr:unnamed protein product [Adineta ricciae]CAF1343690.1 unnamed protein product [Adineta ricciae]
MQIQSVYDISNMGTEFIPMDNSFPPLLTFQAKSFIRCGLQCNIRIDCRVFDFDVDSQQCRLWGADLTAGTISLSSSKPRSSVGSVKLSPNIYANSHNQSCDKCFQSRYEICNMNSSTCQCPSNTFWNGLVCQSQLFQNQICAQADACRSDLNLTCQPNCDFTYRCSSLPAIGIGQTVAGYCNNTSGNATILNGPWGLYVSPVDGTLYVADEYSRSFLAFSPFSRKERILLSSGLSQPMDIFVDNSNTIYMTDRQLNGGTLLVQQKGTIVKSFPAPGYSTSSCLLNGLYQAYGVAVDRSGNIFVASWTCSVVVKLAPNATNVTVVAGKMGTLGSTNNELYNPRFVHLDEDRGVFYVSDSRNHRIQKFIIGGNGTGTTVAGGNGAGTGLNQLYSPAGLCITRDGQTLYIADRDNNRVMKWAIGANVGSFVAGDVNGATGSSDRLFNGLGDVALDPSETYLYVADEENHRIQRFRLQ